MWSFDVFFCEILNTLSQWKLQYNKIHLYQCVNLFSTKMLCGLWQTILKKNYTHNHIQNSGTLMNVFVTCSLPTITISLTSWSTSSAGAKRDKKYNHAVARAHTGTRYNIWPIIHGVWLTVTKRHRMLKPLHMPNN